MSGTDRERPWYASELQWAVGVKVAFKADAIREHVVARLATLATACGTLLAIRSGDVVRSMGLVNRTPAVCSVLEGTKFQQMAGLELVERSGPAESTTTTYLYKRVGPVSPGPVEAGGSGTPGPRLRQANKRTAHSPGLEASARVSTTLPPADLCLVSCGATKLPHSAPAKVLYTSDLFRKTRSLVDAKGWPWFILSAKYGIVAPEQVIEPYEKTLNTMRVAERRDWADGCFDALGPHLAGVKSVVFFAGAQYRKFLAPALRGRGIEVHVPMARLRIGEQSAWLNRQLREHAAGS